jgi:uncharacterized protein YoxC
MQLLTILTLGYAAILVLALAVTLVIAIIYLFKIAGVMKDVNDSLQSATEKTSSLEENLSAMQGVLPETEENLSKIKEDLESAEAHLTSLVGRSEKAGAPN